MIRAASDWCNSLDTLNVSGCFTLIFRQLKQLEEAIFTPVNCPKRPSIKIQQALSFETEMMNRTNISKRADFRESWDESDHSYLRWLVDYHLPRYFRVLFTPVSNLNRPKPLPPLPPCTHTSFTALPLIASDRPSIQPIKKIERRKRRRKRKNPLIAQSLAAWSSLRPAERTGTAIGRFCGRSVRWRRGDGAVTRPRMRRGGCDPVLNAAARRHSKRCRPYWKATAATRWLIAQPRWDWDYDARYPRSQHIDLR